jgi:hypothetical protein
MDLLLMVAAISLLLGFFLIFLLLGRRSQESALLAEVTSHMGRGAFGRFGWGWITAERLAKPFEWFRSLFRGEPNPEVVQSLTLAGYRKAFHADVFTGVRLILPVVLGILVAMWVHSNIFLWFLVAIITGFFIPQMWLNKAIKKRREKIQIALPDALDLLTICMEAGLGLDQALIRVGQELNVSHPELCEEFLQINLEQRAGSPRMAEYGGPGAPGNHAFFRAHAGADGALWDADLQIARHFLRYFAYRKKTEGGGNGRQDNRQTGDPAGDLYFSEHLHCDRRAGSDYADKKFQYDYLKLRHFGETKNG